MILLVSDLHEHQNEITAALSKWRALKNEVLLFHLLGRNEMAFDYTGFFNFEDLETGKSVQVDAQQARASYLKNLQHHLQATKQALREQNLAYELLTLDQPLDFALRKYLMQRAKL